MKNLPLNTPKNDGISEQKEQRPVITDQHAFISELYSLSGKEIMDRILEHQNPKEIVNALSGEDFFWLVKKIGEDDCITLLELASEEQWQYLLDLEIWRKDRFDPVNASQWMKRLQTADTKRLVRWMFNEGQSHAYYHFHKSLEVLVVDVEDDDLEFPEGYFTLDNVYHFKAVDPEYQETVEKVIRTMADEDLLRYQAFFSSLSGILPAEMEEEMYRLRNVRLAEHGFLPYEEALSVYASLDPEAISMDQIPALSDVPFDDGIAAMIPVSPLHHAGVRNMLTETLAGFSDPILMDRIRLEFAGLCNQILSAEGYMEYDLDDLVKICRKAGRVLNLAIERLCGMDLSAAEALLRNHSLVSLFRVGFGLALKLKWEAERWVTGSWFYTRGLDIGLWGERWGGILTGILDNRPKFYTDHRDEEEYRDFEWLHELSESLQVLRRLMVLDSLMERLTEHYGLKEGLTPTSDMTFMQLLFNLWGRVLLKLKPGFTGISQAQAKELFSLLRGDNAEPPYRMTGYRETFIQDFMTSAPNADPEAASILKETLTMIWHEFREEYEWVLPDDLDGRYSRLITIAH